jgi:hypothetical protein
VELVELVGKVTGPLVVVLAVIALALLAKTQAAIRRPNLG